MTGTNVLFGLWLIQGALLMLSVCLGTLQTLRQKRSPSPRVTDTPSLTVVIAAYNEAASIRDCLRSVLDSSLHPQRVIVVDDGSTDVTGELAAKVLGEREYCRIIRNGYNLGKARALDRALGEVETDCYFTLDADTRLARDTLERVMATLVAEELDAVACRVVVEPAHGPLAGMQDVEYEALLQLDRLAQTRVGIVTTIPGAGGLYRTAIVRAAGGYTSRTLAEDTDLTLAIQRRGGRVGAAIDAPVSTIAPRSVEELLKQRERWVWGNLGAVGWHLASNDPATAKFLTLTLPTVLILNAILPMLFVVVLILAPVTALSGSVAFVSAGSVAIVSLALLKTRVAFFLAGRRSPGLVDLMAAFFVLPLLVSYAAARGLARRLARIPNCW
jgi:cellulose synthase/poly-beta-1,6-N-acetylglucosamine synthase-like glycosyltransferase